MKIKALLLGFFLCSFAIQAQNMISMASVHPAADTISGSKQELAIRYPSLRQVSVVANSFGYGDFDSKLNDQDFASGKTRSFIGFLFMFICNTGTKYDQYGVCSSSC